MTIPIQAASKLNIRFIFGANNMVDGFGNETNTHQMNIRMNEQDRKNQQIVMADVHNSAAPFSESITQNFIPSAASNAPFTVSIPLQNEEQPPPLCIVKPTIKSSDDEVVVSETQISNNELNKEFYKNQGQETTKQHLFNKKNNTNKKRVSFDDENLGSNNTAIKENSNNTSKNSSTSSSSSSSSSNINNGNNNSSGSNKLSLSSVGTVASSSSSSFENSLKENYKTYARRAGALLSENIELEEAIEKTDDTKKVAEVLATLMTPQETRLRLDPNVRVVLYQQGNKNVMLKVSITFL